jgi:ABC-type proline/glycine betaine transport system permease subunit
VLRGRLFFALLWTAISAIGIWTMIAEPLPGDEWLLIFAGFLVLTSLALLLDVIVRFFHTRKVDSPPPDS